MNFEQMLHEKKISEREKNIQMVRKEIYTPDVQLKINNHCDRFGGRFTPTYIINQIMTNDLVASCFCKEPTKQNIAELYGLELLGLEKLASSGKKCIRFSSNGDIVHTALGNTKSADTIYNEAYVTMKYTDECGGAQDNQKRDVIDFLEKGSKKNKVCAILDGPYWEKKRQELKKLFQYNPNVKITSIDEILNLQRD